MNVSRIWANNIYIFCIKVIYFSMFGNLYIGIYVFLIKLNSTNCFLFYEFGILSLNLKHELRE